jgi:hypothetical protein
MLSLVAATAGSLIVAPHCLAQAHDDYMRTAGGLTVYLGVMPAEIIKGQPKMHGGAPTGPHEQHIVVAIFDAASAARVSDATVTAKVSGLGLSGSEMTLEPMNIVNTITYGGFFDLPGVDLYTIAVSVRRPGSRQPVVFDFKYDHRRQ